MPTYPELPTPTKDEAMLVRILLAAQQLFQQYGLHKVTMNDIARAIGKGKSSIYYYFKDKEEIFLAVLDREIREILASVAEAVAQATTAEDKLYAFCATRLSKLRQKASLHAVMVGDIVRNADFVHAIRWRYRQQESDLLRQILTFDQPASLSAADLEALLLLVLGGMHGLEQEVLFTKDMTLLEPAMRLMSRALIRELQHPPAPARALD